MTHIPFQHSYAKGGSACYTRSTASATATMPTSTAPAENSAASVGGGTSASAAAGVAAGPPATLYSDASSSMSTESFPSDTSCSSEDHDDLNAGDYMMDTPPTSNSSEYTEVPAHTQKKKVLVTGGAGFIGSWVADTLLARGDDVVIVDEVNDYYDVRTKRSNIAMLLEKYGPNRVRFFEGDLCDAPFIGRIFETEGIQWVVHMAARAGVRPSIQDPFIYVHSNVEATTRLLELSRVHGVKSFVFASSSSVYGGSPNEVFRETDVVDFPVSPYAATKKSCELMAHTYNHLYGLNIAALRFFTVYGPRGRPDMAPFKFIDLVCRGQEIMQFGDGSTSRDYTYISDIVDGVIRSLDRPAGYQIYNLGNGNPVRLSTFIGLVQESVGHPAKIRICPEQPGDVPRTCADVTKARVMLGYNPRVTFADGIRATVSWYKERFGCAADGDTATATANTTSLVTEDVQKVNEISDTASVTTITSDKAFLGEEVHDVYERVTRSLSNAVAMEFIGLKGDGGAADPGVYGGGRPRSMSKPGRVPEPVSGARARRSVSVSYVF